jgi:hypothetical protein
MARPQSFSGKLQELESSLCGEARFVDIALALTRAKDKSTLLYAGGQWDRLDKRFTSATPERVALVALEESQVAFVSWFAEWLRAFREGYPRDASLVLNAGDRRGGKTFSSVLAQVAALIDVPLLLDGTPTIGWAVSKSYRQRDELDAVIAGFVPDRLYHHRRAPEHIFEFAHGSRLRNLSADDPDALKQGRVDFLLYNEGQLMSPRAIRNGLYGTSDRGGITVLACNPPTGPAGDWLRDLKDAIDRDPETSKIARFFNFSSKLNTKVDQPARRRNVAIARHIDPDMADADADGTWRSWGDLACPAFDKRQHVGLPPDVGAIDVTAEVTRKTLYAGANFVIGGDFQRRPQAAAVLRVFRSTAVDGNVYCFVDECGVKGTETELSTALMGSGHDYSTDLSSERSALWIGDCSGSYQGAMRIKGQTSYALLEADGWKIFPAEVIKAPNSERPKNPLVAQRLGVLYRAMAAGRVRVSPNCAWIIESFSKCTLRKTSTGTRVPQGHLAHILDAASYAIYRLEPKPKTTSSMPPRGSIRFGTRPSGIRIL